MTILVTMSLVWVVVVPLTGWAFNTLCPNQEGLVGWPSHSECDSMCRLVQERQFTAVFRVPNLSQTTLLQVLCTVVLDQSRGCH